MENNTGKSRKAVTIAGIEALFSEFEALYGVRFADMWQGTDIAYVKSLWANGLVGFVGQGSPFGAGSMPIQALAAQFA